MDTRETNNIEHVPVLIVGGSVVGLSTALFLAWHGIRALLIERHASTSIHTRAAGFSQRTMELYRQIGIESAIFQQETPPEQLGEMGLHAKNLVSSTPGNNEAAAFQQYQQVNPFASPTLAAMVGQDKLEPILRARATELGSDIRFGCEMLNFTQTADGITARIRERATEAERTIHARYLVAADGNKSTVRQHLGIPSYGYGTLGHWVSILFQTDLSSALHGRKISLCFVNNATVEGIIGQSEGRWSLFTSIKPRPGEQPDALPNERLLELIRAAIGIPDQPIQIISTLYWELAARVAEHYQRERVFLVGDAAHVMTTMGAFGANTGIADAHNLAWKLAAVLKGDAHPDLLATYGPERQMAANLAVAVSTGLYIYRLPNHPNSAAITRSAQDMIRRVRQCADTPDPTGYSVTSGYRYHSEAILSGKEETGTFFENTPSATPGTRAPHVWLRHNDQQISTLDLYGKNFVLLTGPDGKRWHEEAARAKQSLKLDMDVYSIGQDERYVDSEQNFLTTYGIANSGAVLIRPDGFIAWRAYDTTAHTKGKIEQILKQILCR